MLCIHNIMSSVIYARFVKRAKLFVSMRLGVSRAVRRLAFAVAASITASACTGNPGGPQTSTITVTAISPSSGTTFGGTTVTITGTGFSQGVNVTIGGTAATNISVTGSTTITATTPTHIAGAAEVRVTKGSSAGSLPNGFVFTAPSSTPNLEPVVSAVTVQPPRANQPVALASIGDRISLTVSVNDAETPVSQLTYEWSAVPSVGTFTGTGPAVQWTAPASLTSPQTVALMVTIVERYQEADTNGLPVQREHRVQRSAAVKVHNSQKEVTDMAIDFWQLFLTPSITNPDAVLHNFSTTCDGGRGRAAEYSDIVDHRNVVAEVITYTLTPPTVFEYGFGSRSVCSNKFGSVGDACVEVPVFVRERVKGATTPRETRGTGFLTGVYENAQWRLCYSLWTGIDTLTGQPVFYDVADRKKIIKGPQDK